MKCDDPIVVEAGPCVTRCPLPPPGWICTRKSSHKGPCAAVPEVEVFRLALLRIARMPEEPIWSDDRDDAANEMVEIAEVALGQGR